MQFVNVACRAGQWFRELGPGCGDDAAKCIGWVVLVKTLGELLAKSIEERLPEFVQNFLVAQDGSYLVKHRAGNETTHDVQGRSRHSAVAAMDDDGRSVNALEVRVGADATDFVVNGVVVHSAPKSGMAARTDGIWGVRVNHVLPAVLIEGLGVTR